MNIKLLNEHNLEFLSFKEGYTGSPESIHFKREGDNDNGPRMVRFCACVICF